MAVKKVGRPQVSTRRLEATASWGGLAGQDPPYLLHRLGRRSHGEAENGRELGNTIASTSAVGMLPMKPRIDLDDLQSVMEAVSFQGLVEARAYVCREDGTILLDVDGSEDIIPDDIDDRSRYLVVPDKRDLDLGQALVHRFVRLHMPAEVDAVRELFRRRGGYRRFRDLLERSNMLDTWHAFENERVLQELADWAESNGFEVDRGKP
jgi:hypothetical protein